MLKYSVSSIITMNVFGSSQASETKKIISNLEQSIKSYTNKIDKIDKIEQYNKSMLVLEEQTENIQLTCLDIVQRMSNTAAPLENIEGIKKIFPSIQSQLNTIETYIKDKP